MANANARHILVSTEEACLKLKADIEGGADFAAPSISVFSFWQASSLETRMCLALAVAIIGSCVMVDSKARQTNGFQTALQVNRLRHIA